MPTSPQIASLAAQQLRSKKTSKTQKKVDGSDLAQAKQRSKRKIRK